MTTKRKPWYPTKAAWAAAQAAAARAQASNLPTHASSDWRKVRARMASIRHLNREAERFERLAEQYRQRGE